MSNTSSFSMEERYRAAEIAEGLVSAQLQGRIPIHLLQTRFRLTFLMVLSEIEQARTRTMDSIAEELQRDIKTTTKDSPLQPPPAPENIDREKGPWNA